MRGEERVALNPWNCNDW